MIDLLTSIASRTEGDVIIELVKFKMYLTVFMYNILKRYARSNVNNNMSRIQGL